ncbi:hypothetical protein DFJ74DRAFT_695475 [Hyaloraphidium curvatum]|nr:hypothetical protein DFJ74DRAFT_695475 [Hyaloraphidium curvatum]
MPRGKKTARTRSADAAAVSTLAGPAGTPQPVLAANEDPPVQAPTLPNELLSVVVDSLAHRGWKATLLEFMLASKACYVLGLRGLAGGARARAARRLWRGEARAPRAGVHLPRRLLDAPRFTFHGDSSTRLVRKLRISPGIKWSTKRLKVLQKILPGVERLDMELHGAKVTSTLWTMLKDARELKWLRLRLKRDAADAFGGVSGFPQSVADFVLCVDDAPNGTVRNESGIKAMLAGSGNQLQRIHFERPNLAKLDWHPAILGKVYHVSGCGWPDVLIFSGKHGMTVTRLSSFRTPIIRLADWNVLTRLGVEELELADVEFSDVEMVSTNSDNQPRGLKRLVLRRYRPLSRAYWPKENERRGRMREWFARAGIAELLGTLDEDVTESDAQCPLYRREVAFWESIGVKWVPEAQMTEPWSM